MANGDMAASIRSSARSTTTATPERRGTAIGAEGAIEVAAIRAIKKDEEICVSYVEPWVLEAERRGRIMAHIGKVYERSRCVQEREAAANGGDGDVSDGEKMRRDVEGAHILS